MVRQSINPNAKPEEPKEMDTVAQTQRRAEESWNAANRQVRY
jgi:hypothetical protein